MTAVELKKDYLLALKVMRLTRPTLVSALVCTSEPPDLPGPQLEQQLLRDVCAVRGSETLAAAGQFMLLPQSFGNIYLGETFSSYICVHNCTAYPVQNVVVKADLQSDKLKISLPIHASRQTPITLQPGETLDDIIHHEVKEIGVHILVCEVQYSTPNEVPETFRKFFKFHVFKPLDVKTKFYNAADTDEVYLEAQIQNITAGTICLESVELEASDAYQAQPLNTLPNGESVFRSKHQLQPQNSCQFLYCLRPTTATAAASATGEQRQRAAAATAVAIDANNIGKMDIIWRSNLGERGRLQTSALHRNPVDHGDLRLSVLEAASTVRCGQPYDMRCRLTNTSQRSMDLHLALNVVATLGCGYTGASEFMLGTVEADKSVDFSLTVCPVRHGLIKIGRLQLTDVFVKQTYNFNDFVQVFVLDNNSGSTTATTTTTQPDVEESGAPELEKGVWYGMEKLSLAT